MMRTIPSKGAIGRVARLAQVSTIVLALTGCRGPGMISDRLYLDTTHEPCGHGAKRVEILQSPPDREYTRVAYVESFATFYAKDEVDWGMLRTQLCHQASKVDADAIIELAVGSRPYSRLVQVLGFEVSVGGETKKLTGIAIRYDEPSR